MVCEQLVDRVRKLVLHPRDICRLHIESLSAAIPEGTRLEFRETTEAGRNKDRGREPPGGIIFPLSISPVDVSLPRGWYYPVIRYGDARYRLAHLDLTGGEANLRVAVPGIRRVCGMVRGQLSGPLDNAEVRFHGVDGTPAGMVHADSSGRFQATLLIDGVFEAVAKWPGSWQGQPDFMRQVAHFPVGDDEVEVLRRESRLILRPEAEDALSSQARFGVHQWDPRTGGWQRLRGGGFTHKEAHAILLPPGEYAITWELLDVEFARRTIVVKDGQEVSLGCPRPGLAVLRVDVAVPEGYTCEADFELRALDGEVVRGTALALGPKTESIRVVRVVPGDIYEVFLEGSLWPSGVSPEDRLGLQTPFTWTDGVNCVAGELSSVQIHLP